MATCKKDISKKVSEMTIQDDKIKGYFPLKMTVDKKTEMYVKFAKVMVILQGPYTDERSLVCGQVKEKFKYASRFINDDTYKLEENTICKAEETEEFHCYFRREARKALEEGNNLLLIDSSLSNINQNFYYAALANKMQYVVLVVPPIVTGQIKDCWPPKSQAGSFRNVGTFIQSSTQFQHLFCAWYLHDVDSFELRHEAELYIQDCIEDIPELKEMFSRVPDADVKLEMDTETFTKKLTSNYFKLDDKWQDIAYCCTKVFNNQLYSMNEYFKNEDVQRNYGKMSKLSISGFVISPHMVAARVKLSYNQKNIWDMQDEFDENSEVPILCPSDLHNMLKAELPKIEVQQICTKSNQTMVNPGRTSHVPTDNIPVNIKGRGCHIVLGRAMHASARDVDYGVQFALRRLSRAGDTDIEVINLERCVVRRIGKYWLIDLKEMLSVDAFFASCAKPFPYDNSLNAISRVDPTKVVFNE